MSASLLLARPKAIRGESLSSWRQRVAWANGYRLFPVADERTRRSDPDIGYLSKDFEWVANLHGCTESDAKAMTLRQFVGVIDDRVSARSHPQWWLRARYGRNALKFGPMFCPQCLASDQIPHFRLEWRFGFHTTCFVHECMLLDQCPYCLTAPWPSGCGLRSEVHPHFENFRFCWHCGQDISSIVGNRVKSNLDLYDRLREGSTSTSMREYPTIEVLSAVRSVCQAFLRSRASAVISQSTSEWKWTCTSLSKFDWIGNAVEYLNVEARHLLVQSALTILSDWPNSFLTFAADTGISRSHFDGALHMSPPWMQELVRNELSKQNRTVTQDVLQATFQTLRQAYGRAPTKREIQKHLNWQGVKGLDALPLNEEDVSRQRAHAGA